MPEINRRMASLKKIPVFDALVDEQIMEIANHVVERIYRRGAVVFMEGDDGRGLHYVQSGKVKIVKTAVDGREHIIKIMGAGEIFAEVLLFCDLQYPATAIAVEDSCIGLICNQDLEKLILSNNELALAFIKALSQRLLYAQQKIKILALNDVMARMAEVLLRLAAEHGRPIGDCIELQLDLSRQELASLAGTTRETATRMLGTLKKQAVIDFEGSKIKIINHQALQQLGV